MGFSKYPNEIDDQTTLPITTDLITKVRAEVVNRLRDSIIATQSELGTSPSSVFGTVAARLFNIDSNISSILSNISILDSEINSVENILNNHVSNTNNPHETTAEQLNVPNLVSSSNDEAIVRFDGILGQHQNTVNGPFINDLGAFRLLETSDPSNVSNNGFLYTKDVSSITNLFYLDSAGNITQLSNIDNITGTGTDNSLAKWDGASSMQGSGITVDDSENISGVNELSLNSLYFPIDATPSISQVNETNSGVSGADFTIHAQDSIGSGSKSGGNLTLRAGDAIGGTDSGGNLTLRPGEGDSSSFDGSVFIASSDETARLTVDSTLITLGHAALFFDQILDSNCLIGMHPKSDDDGYDLFVQAQESRGNGNIGGDLHMLGGTGTDEGEGNGGHVRIAGGSGSGTGADGNVALGSFPSSWQSAESIVFMSDTSSVPSGDPSGGHFLYSESGALRGRGASGTITTIAPADPHCQNCGRDCAVEWENESQKWKIAVCMWCLTNAIEDGIIYKEQR